MLALLTAILVAWFPVPTPDGQIVTVTIRVEHGSIGDVYAFEADNDNPTPTCGAGRAERVCVVTATPLTQIGAEWVPYTPRCGQLPTLTATTDGGVTLYRETVSLPDGVACIYLPEVRR